MDLNNANNKDPTIAATIPFANMFNSGSVMDRIILHIVQHGVGNLTWEFILGIWIYNSMDEIKRFIKYLNEQGSEMLKKYATEYSKWI